MSPMFLAIAPLDLPARMLTLVEHGVEVSPRVSWPVALLIGLIVGSLLGRYLRMRRDWVISDFRSMVLPLITALVVSLTLFMVLTMTLDALGYIVDFSGMLFTLQFSMVFMLSSRLEPVEPWWQFWRWRRTPPPQKEKRPGKPSRPKLRKARPQGRARRRF